MRKFVPMLLAIFLLSTTLAATSYAGIEPGVITSKLNADLDADGQTDVLVIRRSKPPAICERVEIFRNQEEKRPAFTSEWKELVEGLQMSAKGEVKLEKVGNRVVAKYIWRERGQGTGEGHESEHITYYGHVDGRFAPVFEYTAKNIDWSKGRFGNLPYLKEQVSTLRFEDVDGDGEEEICISIRERAEEPKKIGEEFSPLRTNTVQRLLRYKWEESKGFVLTEEKKIGE